MRRVFLSDLHLADPDTDAFRAFTECLEHESSRNDEIYILGDLVEMWVGDDDDSTCAQTLRQALSAGARRCSIYVMHGNRDFLFGSRFAQDTGTSLIDDPHVTEDRVLLSHGDALCTDDETYQAVRTTLRSAEWRADILGRTLTERQTIGAAMRAQSMAANANKPSNIMDVNPEAMLNLMRDHDCTTLVHGHTHRPGMYRHSTGIRYVLGAWERCGWLLRERDGSFSLQCFALAARYGI